MRRRERACEVSGEIMMGCGGRKPVARARHFSDADHRKILSCVGLCGRWPGVPGVFSVRPLSRGRAKRLDLED